MPLLSLEPAQVMLCAAHNSDLAAAQALGLRTAFIARPTEYGPHQAKDFEATGAWDYVTRDMQDSGGADGRLRRWEGKARALPLTHQRP